MEEEIRRERCVREKEVLDSSPAKVASFGASPVTGRPLHNQIVAVERPSCGERVTPRCHPPCVHSTNHSRDEDIEYHFHQRRQLSKVIVSSSAII
jgi:hypothetical protein